MKKIVVIILLFCGYFSQAQQCKDCNLQFDTLLTTLNKKIVTKDDLQKCTDITVKLINRKYYHYIDSTSSKSEHILYSSHSLTKTYADLCLKCGGEFGVHLYINYCNINRNSAEEEISFSLERIFVKYPEITLKEIKKDSRLLDRLIWGFLNNRYYGAKNPYEDNDFRAMTVYENELKPILNDKNCEEIFYQLNPKLKYVYPLYKYQIDYILNGAKKNLSEIKSINR